VVVAPSKATAVVEAAPNKAAAKIKVVAAAGNVRVETPAAAKPVPNFKSAAKVAANVKAALHADLPCRAM